MQQIGFFPGTFDPVHEGHLSSALYAKQALGLDRVIFFVAGRTRFRQPEADLAHRAAMLELSITSLPGLGLVQLNGGKKARSALELSRLAKQLYPDARLSYLMGADKAARIPHWADRQALFSACKLLILPRVGYDAQQVAQLLRSLGGSATALDMQGMYASSGMVRARLRLLQDAEGLISQDVSAYIAEHGLYQPGYQTMLRQAVSPQRFRHSLGVRSTAVQLAKEHGAPLQKAGVAAILHDCAKNMELSRLQAIARQARLTQNPQVLSSNALLHGLVGAHLARTRYHISDVHILNAIRYHTTGRAGMNLTELVLFVADAIEPARSYKELALIRQQAQVDLRLAALTSLLATSKYVRLKGGTDSPLSLEAIEDLKRRLAFYPDPKDDTIASR